MRERILHADRDVRVTHVLCGGQDPPQPVQEIMRGARVVITLRGCFLFRTARESAVGDPARVLVLRDGETYSVVHPTPGGDECLAVAGHLADRLATMAPLSSRLTTGAFLRLHELANQLDRADSVSRSRIEDTIMGACAWSASRKPSENDRTPRIEAVLELESLLASRFSEALPIPALAQTVGLSPSQACRDFRALLGTSIHQYQLDLRLRHALALAVRTRMPLALIAVESGFANQGHLGNRFHRRFGVSPGAFRRRTNIS